MAKFKLNYALILGVIIVIVVIGGSMLLTLNNKVVHVDNNNLTAKNITVQKVYQEGTIGVVKDMEGNMYITSTQMTLMIKADHNYTVALSSVNHGTEWWINSETEIINNETNTTV
jgi:hypothetical protein